MILSDNYPRSKLGLWLKRDVALDSNQTSFFSFGGEDDIFAFFPTLNNESLTREHVGGEPSVNLREALRVFW